MTKDTASVCPSARWLPRGWMDALRCAVPPPSHSQMTVSLSARQEEWPGGLTAFSHDPSITTLNPDPCWTQAKDDGPLINGVAGVWMEMARCDVLLVGTGSEVERETRDTVHQLPSRPCGTLGPNRGRRAEKHGKQRGDGWINDQCCI